MDWVIDADAHVTEPGGVWRDRVAKRHWDRVPHIRRDAETEEDHWYIDGARASFVGITAPAGWREPYPSRPRNMDEVPPAAFDAKARVDYLDSVGVWAQVIYPNVGGFGNARFLAMDDPDLRLECVRAYNDWLLEWCAEAPGRLIPIMATPFWDIAASVAEVERCAALGHRGVLFTGEPHRFDMPYFGDRRWDPFWSTVEDSGLSLSFHIGPGGTDNLTNEARRAAHGNGASGARAVMDLFLGNGLQVADLLLSGVLPRFPRLKAVSVESGAGWAPFVLEGVDHFFREYRAGSEMPQYEAPPSEYFRRQVFVCYFFEKLDLPTLVRDVGVDNLLFETDYPHSACLYGDAVRETIDAGTRDLAPEARRKLLWQNSADLYGVAEPAVGAPPP